MQDFKKTPIWWKWFLWAVLVLPLSFYIIYSTTHTWPSLLWLAIPGGITVVGCSIYIARHITDIQNLLRSRAFTAAVFLESALILNGSLHGGISRAYENAGIAEVQRKSKLEERLKVDREKTENFERRQRAESEKLLAQAQADKNAAAKLRAQTDQFRTTGIIRTKRIDNSNSVNIAISPTPIESQESETEEKFDSPAKVLKDWFPFVFGGFILEIIAAAIGGFSVLHKRLEFENKTTQTEIPDNQKPYQTSETSLPSRPKTANFDTQKVYPQAHAKTPARRPKANLRGIPAKRPQSTPRLTSEAYPNPGTDRGTDAGVLRQTPAGTYWEVLGRTFPVIKGIRYAGKRKKIVVEVWTEGREWVTQFRKSLILELDQIPDLEKNLSRKRDIINKALASKSEKDFASNSTP